MKDKIILLFLFAAFLSFHPAMGQTPLTQDEIKSLPHITATQAYILSKQNKIVLLDVHDGSNRSKILGAYYLPSKKIANVRLKIPKDQLIGVFCD
jgi:hypothetical protein